MHQRESGAQRPPQPRWIWFPEETQRCELQGPWTINLWKSEWRFGLDGFQDWFEAVKRLSFFFFFFHFCWLFYTGKVFFKVCRDGSLQTEEMWNRRVSSVQRKWMLAVDCDGWNYRYMSWHNYFRSLAFKLYHHLNYNTLYCSSAHHRWKIRMCP